MSFQLPISLVPVSYTHLDVYKRQALSTVTWKSGIASLMDGNTLKSSGFPVSR